MPTLSPEQSEPSASEMQVDSNVNGASSVSPNDAKALSNSTAKKGKTSKASTSAKAKAAKSAAPPVPKVIETMVENAELMDTEMDGPAYRLSRVQKIIKMDNEQASISREAVFILALAAEEITKSLTKAGWEARTGQRTELTVPDLANAVASSSKLSLLQDIIPQTVPLKVAKAHREGKDPVPNPPDALHSMLASVQEQLKAARGYSGTGHKQGATANATNTHRPYSQREARALSHNSKKSNTTGNSSGRSQQAANSGLIPLPNNTMGSLPLPPGMQIPPGMQLVAIPPGFDYRNMPPPPPGMTYAPVPITFSPTGVPIINTTPTTGSGSGEGGYGSGIRWVHNPSSSSTSTPNMNANATTNASGGNGSGSGGESTPAHLLSSHQPPQMQSILQQSSTSPPQSQSSQQGQGTWTVQTTTAPILSSSTDANNANSTFGVLKPAGFSRSKKKKNDSTSTPAAAAAPSIGSAQAPSSSTTPAIPAEAPITKSPPSSSSATIHPSQLQGRTIYNTGVGSGSPSKAANHSSETPASITPNEVNTTSEEQQQITPVKRKGRKSTRGGGT